ncbi:hypothetical protein B0H11DRAFT_2381324 [Mycena galericulata]|nr:hypothetical protein B0H11DRAFT_2381324 [Mycena galericulata]
MPSLWFTLYFNFDFVETEPGLIEERIQLWLDRAESQPLSIHFRLRGFFVGQEWRNRYMLHHIRNLLQGHSNKIHCLELDISQSGISQLGLHTQKFPIRTSATFGDAWSPDPEEQYPLAVFGNAPLLQKFRMAGYASPLSSYSLPWSQLTRFEGEIDDMELFKSAQNLVEVRCAAMGSPTAPTSTISHPRLRSLALIETEEGDPAPDILEYLTLPALQSLDISAMSDTTYASLQPFIARSSPPLLSLSIRVDDPQFTDWAECLDRVGTTLENLELYSPSEKVQLSLLNPESGQFVPRLPNLRALTFLNVSPANYSAFVAFLCRTPGLRSLRLSCPLGTFLDDETTSWFRSEERAWHDSFYNHFARYAERGMNINISTPTETYLELIGSS